ncbi:S-adenosyl-L-methionine-dependent methyltransferase [Saccharata proteae CBS 121410]|uniref:DNA (cytosine-5-)-methyltransferase n=1 Tax=Saccharata proteae CBS 121410 TaxID=1314787 RepID=A0A9P4HXA3_9PEZI|nr:S-adenosyl-L-methionine-dependent methyltransferase [Saccharata proteae CBS 121410]
MLVVDGFVTYGKTKRYIQAIEFEILSIDGYEDACATVRDKIYIQSTLSQRKKLWYRLTTPSKEYLRYYKPFLWIADLSKHVVNYLQHHNKVCLEDFRHRFHTWLTSTYGSDPIFKNWHSQYGRLDYRSQINANILFLWKEISSVFTNNGAAQEPLWKDLNFHADSVIKEQPMITLPTKTVVTPWAGACFQQMSFAKILDPRAASLSVMEASNQRREDLGFVPEAYVASKSKSTVNLAHSTKSKVVVGDVVLIHRDQEGKWKDKAETWLAYVQGIKKDRRLAQKDELLVLWLYRPEDTTIGDGLYKFPQELFLSDHCNCEDGVLTRKDVIRKVDVQWYRIDDRAVWQKQYQMRPVFEYVVRTIYRTGNEEHSFQTLWRRHFECQCLEKSRVSMRSIMDRYPKGDSVWLKPSSSSKERILQPVVIVRYLPEDRMVEVRRLLRQDKGTSHPAYPNELEWTDEFYKVSVRRIERRIQIRFFSRKDISEDKIPAPYNRGGTGDCCFIVSAPWIPENELNQGFDPATPRYQPLRGLEMFAGSGGFGRGLEEGQAVEFHYAIDWDRNAVHSYAANKKNRLYFGSVNDYLAKALGSSESDLIARVGDVDFIAAGSPCQAYSSMNLKSRNEEGTRNASMVASVASFIDLYRPKHAVLENVPGMATSKEGPSAFTQFLATIVAMGYQVQQFRLDAWSLGDAQSRSRLFISITAPGLTPQPHPLLTHAHPPNTPSASLGTNVNNEHFGKRIFQTPAFRCPKAREQTSDLPFLGDARPGTCVKFPDHRLIYHLRHLKRLMISQIPVFPPKQGVVQAMQKGLLPEPIVKHFTWSPRVGSKGRFDTAWSRVDGDGLIPTIKTAARPDDRIAGRLLHWSEHRALTIQEARRAQGVPDDVVIVGSPHAQWKQIGNAVSGGVASALGLSLREAWLADQPMDDIIDLTQDDDMDGVDGVDGVANNHTRSETVAISPRKPESKMDSDDIVVSDKQPLVNQRTPATNRGQLHRLVATQPATESRPSAHDDQNDKSSDPSSKDPLVMTLTTVVSTPQNRVPKSMRRNPGSREESWQRFG